MTDDRVLRRHSLRLGGCDYARQGRYFVTLVTAQRQNLFGEVTDGRMRLNELGEVVTREWIRSANLRAELALDDFVAMPNHLHGIVVLNPALVGAHGHAPLRDDHPSGLVRPPQSLGSFVAGFKSAVTRAINDLRTTPHEPVWQRNYYEHIIRSDAELDRVRAYVLDNPRFWTDDAEFAEMACPPAQT